MNVSDLFAVPEAVDRWGETLFRKLPLYRTHKPYRPIYINVALFTEIFGYAADWESMQQAIAQTFSVTLTAKGKAPQAGWAYADYQADPLGVSLGGNQGSGRAYYTGRVFNIKGEKTPLATSTVRRLSDGLLEAERAIWETAMANILAQELDTPVAPILAILDMQEMCSTVWRREKTPRVKIIRVDRDAALDRVTHLFFTQKPQSASQLQATARAFGQQEAAKFMMRILHGTWSPGNISPAGAMIDFDTVCAVKGRAPQFSASFWHPENYFGFESGGQQKILAALAGDTAINSERIPETSLHQVMQDSLVENSARHLLHLMGFADAKTLFATHRPEAITLYETFAHLARHFYPKIAGLSAKVGEASLVHLLDFAIFFRAYPLLRRLDKFLPADAVALMAENTLLQEPLTATYPQDLPVAEASYFESGVYAQFKPLLVETTARRDALCQAAEAFVARYDALFTKLQGQSTTPPLEVEARAYVLNEDRLYLLPAFAPAYAISRCLHRNTPAELNQRISLFIRAGSRLPEQREADLRLYHEGFSFNRLDGSGSYQPCLQLTVRRLTGLLAKAIKQNALEWRVNGAPVPYTTESQGDQLVLTGSYRENTDLLPQLKRENSLLLGRLDLRYKAKRILLGDILED